jgi:endo-beta-N-acetylglucosaminidase D
MVVAVGAGAVGTVAYVKGDLEAVEAKDLDTVYAATLRAADELGLKVTKKSKDAMSAAIIARDAEDKKVTIKLKKTADNTTKLSIRIGVFGNERKSRLIYQAIQDNL